MGHVNGYPLGQLLINHFKKIFITLLCEIEKAVKILFVFFFFYKNFPKMHIFLNY